MSINREMDKEDVVQIYNVCYSAIRRNNMLSEAIWMDLDIVIPSEVSQRKTNSYDISDMWNIKKWYKRTYLQTGRESPCRTLPYGSMGKKGGMHCDIGIDVYTLIYIR